MVVPQEKETERTSSLDIMYFLVSKYLFLILYLNIYCDLSEKNKGHRKIKDIVTAITMSPSKMGSRLFQ